MAEARDIYESFRDETPQGVVSGIGDLLDTLGLDHDPILQALRSTRDLMSDRLEKLMSH